MYEFGFLFLLKFFRNYLLIRVNNIWFLLILKFQGCTMGRVEVTSRGVGFGNVIVYPQSQQPIL